MSVEPAALVSGMQPRGGMAAVRLADQQPEGDLVIAQTLNSVRRSRHVRKDLRADNEPLVCIGSELVCNCRAPMASPLLLPDLAVQGMTMHLLASLAAHGWHAAAWRVTGAAGFAGAAPFRAMAKTAEQGGLDAVLLGLPTAPRARRDGGKVDGIRLDPLPLAGSDDRRHRADRPLRLVAGRRRRAVSCRAGLRDARSSRLGTHRLDRRPGGTARNWAAGLATPICPPPKRTRRRAWSS